MEESFKRLMKLRDLLGLSDTEMANRLNIPKSSMSMYLSGKRKMRQDRLLDVAKAFGVNPVWLMGYDVSMEPDSSLPEAGEEAFNSNYLKVNTPPSPYEELRTAYARNRHGLTKDERMRLAAEILADEENL